MTENHSEMTRAGQAASTLNQPYANEPVESTACEDLWRSCKRHRNILLCILGFLCLGLIVAIFVMVSTNKVKDKKPSSPSQVESGDLSNIQELLTSSKLSSTTNPPEEWQNSVNITESARSAFESNIRLDPNVIPEHYDLTLQPDFKNLLFNGSVMIKLRILKRITHIRLHAKFLNVTSYGLFSEDKLNNTQIEIKEFEYYTPNEYLVLMPKYDIDSGKYVLLINYWGNLTKNGILGLYKSTYLDKESNITKVLVTTKFQPTHARQCFPGFDEPSFKSTFTIKVVKPTHLTALSNMPIKSELHSYLNTNSTLVEFEPTPPMVTYLVTISIGEFAYKKASNGKEKTPIRIYSTPSQVHLTNYAISIAPKILEYFETKFGVKYDLPKLDCIAIPDYASGATENWGLISFRETNLLYNELTATEENKKRIATVIAHEFAHMFFGNLITLKWWDSLWVNEGFASYLEYSGTNAAEKDWHIMNQFFTDDHQSAIRSDGMQSSHPIVQQVLNPNQITEIFGAITYSKSASIIRMLESFLGEVGFNRGIKRLLEKYAYKNIESAEVWEEFQPDFRHNKLKIADIMNSWTLHTGFPLIRAHINLNESQITLSQEKFKETVYIKNSTLGAKDNNETMMDMVNTEVDPDPYHQWIVPLRIRTSLSVNVVTKKNSSSDEIVNYDDYGKLQWLLPPANKNANRVDNSTHKGVVNVTIDLPKESSMVIINGGQLGFFRVLYDREYYKRLQEILSIDDYFLPEERCGLLDDALVLAYTGHLSYEYPFEMLNSIRNVTDPIVWICLLKHFHEINDLLANSEPGIRMISDYYKEFILKIVEKGNWKLNETQVENRTHVEKLFAPKLFYIMCKFEAKPCLDETSRTFDKWLASRGTLNIPIAIKFSVYKWGVSQANESSWRIVRQKYIDETDPQEKINLLRALASTKNTDLIQKLIQDSKNESIVRAQDYFTLFANLADNPAANNLVWTFYREEYDYLVNRFSLNDRYFGRMIIPITKYYSSKEQLKEIKDLFNMHPEAGAAERARLIAIENVKNNILWRKRSLANVSHWLHQYKLSRKY